MKYSYYEIGKSFDSESNFDLSNSLNDCKVLIELENMSGIKKLLIISIQ